MFQKNIFCFSKNFFLSAVGYMSPHPSPWVSMSILLAPCREVEEVEEVAVPHRPICRPHSPAPWCPWIPREACPVCPTWASRREDLLHSTRCSCSSSELRSWPTRSWAAGNPCLKTSNWLFRARGAYPQCHSSSSSSNNSSSYSNRLQVRVRTTGLQVWTCSWTGYWHNGIFLIMRKTIISDEQIWTHLTHSYESVCDANIKKYIYKDICPLVLIIMEIL